MFQEPDQVEEGGEVRFVCKATAEGGKVHFISWTDGNGEDIGSGTSTSGVEEYVLTVSESELGNSKVVVCNIQVEGKKDPYSANCTVNVTGESCHELSKIGEGLLPCHWSLILLKNTELSQAEG